MLKNSWSHTKHACSRLKPRVKKMADVLDVDVEDKGGFSEDEGDGRNIISRTSVILHDYRLKFAMICVALQREFRN